MESEWGVVFQKAERESQSLWSCTISHHHHHQSYSIAWLIPSSAARGAWFLTAPGVLAAPTVLSGLSVVEIGNDFRFIVLRYSNLTFTVFYLHYEPLDPLQYFSTATSAIFQRRQVLISCRLSFICTWKREEVETEKAKNTPFFPHA